MKFCSNCGAVVQQKIPPGDDRPRYVCDACSTIHYQNPKIVAGCIAEWEDQILLCRRAIPPRHGLWTLPAGFMEIGETSLETAMRETMEEANARVQIAALYVVLNLPHVDQIYMMFRARLLDQNYLPGEESLEVQLFNEDQIPWDALAFSTVRHTLKLYFDDRRMGRFRFHMGDIIQVDGRYTGLKEHLLGS
ncbi:MAG: NUDIX hydrolase [Gammaproteobacteria bacterium]|nr:NUDIX hydrolase [Gammaproteobacteria bacterium]MCI0591269.1 NUDIX hydrolase [Gammaproteobacteria bacterium]